MTVEGTEALPTTQGRAPARAVQPPRAWRDRLGIAASSLCAVHCAATALLVALSPALQLGIIADERLEWAAFGLALVVGAGALVPAYRSTHRKRMPMVLFGVGVLVVLCARLAAPEEGPWELVGAVLGAGFMVSGHVANLRLVRQCSAECAADCA